MLLKDSTLQLQPGQRYGLVLHNLFPIEIATAAEAKCLQTGLIGRNGEGKSSLLVRAPHNMGYPPTRWP